MKHIRSILLGLSVLVLSACNTAPAPVAGPGPTSSAVRHLTEHFADGSTQRIEVTLSKAGPVAPAGVDAPGTVTNCNGCRVILNYVNDPRGNVLVTLVSPRPFTDVLSFRILGLLPPAFTEIGNVYVQGGITGGFGYDRATFYWRFRSEHGDHPTLEARFGEAFVLVEIPAPPAVPTSLGPHFEGL